MVEIKDRFGRVIHRGKDLRVLREYISRVRHERARYAWGIDARGWPEAVGLRQNADNSGELHISFGDGAYSDVHFGNYSMMCDTVSAWRKLGDIPKEYYTELGRTKMPDRRVTRETVKRGDVVSINTASPVLRHINGRQVGVLLVATSHEEACQITGFPWELLVEVDKVKVYVGFGDVEKTS